MACGTLTTLHPGKSTGQHTARICVGFPIACREIRSVQADFLVQHVTLFAAFHTHLLQMWVVGKLREAMMVRLVLVSGPVDLQLTVELPVYRVALQASAGAGPFGQQGKETGDSSRWQSPRDFRFGVCRHQSAADVEPGPQEQIGMTVGPIPDRIIGFVVIPTVERSSDGLRFLLR